MGGVIFGIGFAVGLVAGYALTVLWIRHFDSLNPPSQGASASVPSGVPYKRKAEKKKPVVKDEYKEWQIEQEQLKEQGRG